MDNVWKEKGREAAGAAKVALLIGKLSVASALTGISEVRLTEIAVGAKFKDVIEIAQIHAVLCVNADAERKKREVVCLTCGSYLVARKMTALPICLDCDRAGRKNDNIQGGEYGN